MSYAVAVDQLYALGQELASPTPTAPRRKFELAHMRTLAASLGDPQRSFPSILIAGTNGKGSTAATLGSILACAGYRTGLYTSPHLVKVNERIQLSVPTMPSEYSSTDAPISAGPSTLMPISDEDFARHYFRADTSAKRLVESGALPFAPSFFEMLTAIAFLYFAERRVEIAVLEVGLGGRLDATNIVDPLLSILTDIALDHQEYLGSTIAEIAWEKAGILRAGGTLITLPQHPEANRIFGEAAAELAGLRAISAVPYMPSPAESRADAGAGDDLSRDGQAKPGRDVTGNVTGNVTGDVPGDVPARADRLLGPNRYRVTLDGHALLVASPLRGQHQQRNVALAIAAAAELRNSKGYNISDDAIERGIEETLWPGRLQTVALKRGQTLLLDVAHNPAGAWTLRSALAQLPSHLPRTLIFSCLRDKDLGEMTKILFPLFDSTTGDLERRSDHIVLAPIGNPRAAEVTDLLAAAHRLEVPAHAAPHLAAAFGEACEMTPEGGIVVATGSVYLVGEILQMVGTTA